MITPQNKVDFSTVTSSILKIQSYCWTLCGTILRLQTETLTFLAKCKGNIHQSIENSKNTDHSKMTYSKYNIRKKCWSQTNSVFSTRWSK